MNTQQYRPWHKEKLLPSDKVGGCTTIKGSFCQEETKITTVFIRQGPQNTLIEADRISKRIRQMHRHNCGQCSSN